MDLKLEWMPLVVEARGAGDVAEEADSVEVVVVEEAEDSVVEGTAALTVASDVEAEEVEEVSHEEVPGTEVVDMETQGIVAGHPLVKGNLKFINAEMPGIPQYFKQ